MTFPAIGSPITYVYLAGTAREGVVLDRNEHLITFGFGAGFIESMITTDIDREGIVWMRGAATQQQIDALRTARALETPS